MPGIFSRCLFQRFFVFATEMLMIYVAKSKKTNPSFSIVKSICKGAFLPFAGEVPFAEPSLRFIGSDVVMQASVCFLVWRCSYLFLLSQATERSLR